MASVVIGLVGLLFFFLPILGIPVSVFALGFGVMGMAAAAFVGGPVLRWPLAGLAVAGLALGVNLAVYYAPGGEYIPNYNVPSGKRPVPGLPAPPPPAPAASAPLPDGVAGGA
jgi:hypothetical protein